MDLFSWGFESVSAGHLWALRDRGLPSSGSGLSALSPEGTRLPFAHPQGLNTKGLGGPWPVTVWFFVFFPA